MRKDICRFFRTTWIPDETYFQTLVGHLIPSVEIQKDTLTFLVFSDYGMPATFYNDHYDFLVSQDYLFARKISGGATHLREALGKLYASTQTDFQINTDEKNYTTFSPKQDATDKGFHAASGNKRVRSGRVAPC